MPEPQSTLTRQTPRRRRIKDLPLLAVQMPVVKNLEEARRLPVRVEEQQAQQLAMNPPRSAGDGRQEIQLTAMVPIELPVLSNLAGRLLVEVLVRAAGVNELSVPVPVPWRVLRARRTEIKCFFSQKKSL